MNRQEMDVLRTLMSESFTNQRIMSETTGHSLGVINRSIKNLLAGGYLNKEMRLTEKAKDELKKKTPRNAIILAAGFGMRMVPINLSSPKALVEVNGEALIERIIKQLHEVGVSEIIVVVGFMKEQFDYLTDKYGVELVVNSDYATTNNLISLGKVVDRISNSYIIPSDIWCEKNPFDTCEMYSWYMISDATSSDSDYRVNRKKELVKVEDGTGGNAMFGIAYISAGDSAIIRQRLKELVESGKHDDSFWETVLCDDDKMIIPAKVVDSSKTVEINTYEDLRELDAYSKHLYSDALDTIASVFNVSLEEIVDIHVLKKGMTNRSFLFNIHGNKYIMRVPGEGTDRLINRKQEAEVFKAISGYDLCDEPVYIDPDKGYKITKYLEGARVCDAESISDVKRCMEMLKGFHALRLSVPHSFDIFTQIDFYEMLWGGQPSMYKDYERTKANVLELKPLIDSLEKDCCLTHIDAVPDNFLFYRPQNCSDELLQLTDWEYAGMQDPHVDIAMFCIYSLYNKEQVDRVIDLYFDGKCDVETRWKIYAYISMCGLLWSNWCEFKQCFGMEFGEYSLRQYRYAKDYYYYALELKESDSRE